MKFRVFRFLLIILLIFTIIDLYFFWSIFRTFRISSQDSLFYVVLAAGILLWLFILTGILRFYTSFRKNAGPALFNHINIYTGIILFLYCPKILFIPFSLPADLILILNSLLRKDSYLLVNSAGVLITIGLILALIASLIIIYGIFYERFNFIIRKYHRAVQGLPGQFDGIKIIHFSDVHTGSLYGHKDRFAKIVRKINELQPDLILFTGDMVNNFAEELEGWLDVWGGLTAKMGKFAVPGNHDYGEYFSWKDKQQWQSNFDRLMKNIESMGFKLLMNKSARLSLNGQHITIIGVENWGLPPFSQHGDLHKAMENAENNDFKILLSHDPSHWAAQVLGRTDIRLTLSGHTHGMQFGIRTGNIRWSPIKLKYPKWGGWYREGEQLLHVSTGLGYIGVPFRFGIRPEVALIKLTSE